MIVKTSKGDAEGVEVGLNKKLLFIKANKGILCCGYFNKEAFEKFGDAAAIVTGVSSIEELLAGKVAWCSEAAKALGIQESISGKEALEAMM